MPFAELKSAIKFYRKLLALVGKFILNVHLRNGLPEQFSEPLSFLFGRTLTEADQKISDKVEAIRQAIANSGASFNPVSSRLNITRTSTETAFISSVTPEWGVLLYLCAKSFKAQTILELGGNAGISGTYMASAPTCRSFTTIEGSPKLAKLAEQNIGLVARNFQVVNGLFDDVLEETLAGIREKIDLVYIDGPKEYEPTMNYLKKIIPSLKSGSLVIFDDIRWSREMWQMWQAVCRLQGFAYTVDAGRFGLAWWQGDSVQPHNINLSVFTGWLRVRKGYNSLY
jgi:predicted O-methyltransferase YrrM